MAYITPNGMRTFQHIHEHYTQLSRPFQSTSLSLSLSLSLNGENEVPFTFHTHAAYIYCTCICNLLSIGPSLPRNSTLFSLLLIIIMTMSPASKGNRKAIVDVAAWMFNVVTSVGIIIVNKALMATYGYSFATTLTGLHFATTSLMTVVLKRLGYIQASHLPVSELLIFVVFSNFSIVGMNVSLMWNSVGFYQIAKLSMIPVSCFLEVFLDKMRYSRDTKLSIALVLLGVAVCTVTDVSVNAKGFIAAFVAVWSTSMQQYYVHFLQKKYSLGSFNLLGHTAPAQAASLLLLGPVLDYWLTNKRVDTYPYTLASTLFILLSCTIAIGTNLSQFICISRFTAVSFQVIGHMKTVLVLILGFTFFGKEGLNLQVVLGMIIAIVGMIWYGNASSKPGGKERWSPSLLNDKSEKQNGFSEYTELNGKV